MFLIELALLILISIEMYKVRKYFLSKDFYKISDKQMRSAKQYKVNSSYPEDGQYIRSGLFNKERKISKNFRMI